PARLAVIVHQLVAAGHAFQKVLLTDPALPGQAFRQFQRVVSRLPVVFGFALFVWLSFLTHGLLSQGVSSPATSPSARTASVSRLRRCMSTPLYPKHGPKEVGRVVEQALPLRSGANPPPP